MILPEAVRGGIELALGPVERVEVVSGGSITPACRLTAGGDTCFLKYAIDPPAEFFAAEAAGLQALRGVGSDLRVPEVMALGIEGSVSWLVVEWLAPARTPDFSARLGRGLAMVHRSQAKEWGWDRDGFIGSLPQSNRVRSSWPEFWWNERFLPQLTMAEDRFNPRIDHAEIRAALERVLGPVEDEGASLLHGDLWAGNVMDTTGGPALFDPALWRSTRIVFREHPGAVQASIRVVSPGPSRRTSKPPMTSSRHQVQSWLSPRAL